MWDRKIIKWEENGLIEIDAKVAIMIKLTYKEFKITAINMLKNVMDKVGSMHEQMGNVSRKWKF